MEKLTTSLTGKTVTVAGVALPGAVDTTTATGVVLGTNFSFEDVRSIEMQVPGWGRRVIAVDRITRIH